MTVFAVIGDDDANTDQLDAVIQAAYPTGHYRYNQSTWLISVEGQTTRGLSETLGIRKGEITGTVVLQLSGSYWGIAVSAVWDWLKASFERSDG